MSTELVRAEFLYGIDSSVADDDRFYEPPRVVKFRITKKTPKRIYYVTSEDWEKRTRVGFVNRQSIEADGEVYQRNRHWSAPDFHLYLNPPELEQPAKPNLAALKQAMAAAHPDREGGDHEAFIAARARYEKARSKETSA